MAANRVRVQKHNVTLLKDALSTMDESVVAVELATLVTFAIVVLQDFMDRPSKKVAVASIASVIRMVRYLLNVMHSLEIACAKTVLLANSATNVLNRLLF